MPPLPHLAAEELYTQLAEVGLSREEPHPVFGQLAAQLKSFCTRRYIQQERQQGPQGDAFIYRFAEQVGGWSGGGCGVVGWA